VSTDKGWTVTAKSSEVFACRAVLEPNLMNGETSMNIQADRAVAFFDLGEDCIRVESSFLTGMEQVFVNDELISKKLSWRFSSVHAFEIKGQKIEIKIRLTGKLLSSVVIELWVNGEMKDSDLWDVKRIVQQSKQLKGQQSWWKLLSVIFILGVAGAAVGYNLVSLFIG
jgi:hypothetical protein